MTNIGDKEEKRREKNMKREPTTPLHTKYSWSDLKIPPVLRTSVQSCILNVALGVKTPCGCEQ
jgi:hypothetical protein